MHLLREGKPQQAKVPYGPKSPFIWTPESLMGQRAPYRPTGHIILGQRAPLLMGWEQFPTPQPWASPTSCGPPGPLKHSHYFTITARTSTSSAQHLGSKPPSSPWSSPLNQTSLLYLYKSQGYTLRGVPLHQCASTPSSPSL